MPTLYQLSDQYLKILAALSDEEELTEEQMAALLSSQEELTEKLDAYGIVIAELRNKMDLISAEKKRLGEWEKSIKNHISRMKQAAVTALQVAEIDRLETRHWRFSFRKSAAIELDDGFLEWASKSGRDDLLRYSDPQPDKAAIRMEIEAGKAGIPARLIETKNLQIK